MLLEEQEAELKSMSERLQANEGYLNVAVRMLASQGWLDYTVDEEKDKVLLATNAKSQAAFALMDYYAEVMDWVQGSTGFHPKHLDHECRDKQVAENVLVGPDVTDKSYPGRTRGRLLDHVATRREQQACPGPALLEFIPLQLPESGSRVRDPDVVFRDAIDDDVVIALPVRNEWQVETQQNTTCCYAVQDKVWVADPDGNRWEVFVVTDADADQRQDDESQCCTPADGADACC